MCSSLVYTRVGSPESATVVMSGATRSSRTQAGSTTRASARRAFTPSSSCETVATASNLHVLSRLSRRRLKASSRRSATIRIGGRWSKRHNTPPPNTFCNMPWLNCAGPRGRWRNCAPSFSCRNPVTALLRECPNPLHWVSRERLDGATSRQETKRERESELEFTRFLEAPVDAGRATSRDQEDGDNGGTSEESGLGRREGAGQVR